MTTVLARPEPPRKTPRPILSGHRSLCHVIGDRPFASRDRSAGCWPVAIPPVGESWHNSHHGVLRGQIDSSAEVGRMLERLGWVWQVRRPTPLRLAGFATPGRALAGGR
jgi:stearoyl-CoA desaturase (delta-9 desaturase)